MYYGHYSSYDRTKNFLTKGRVDLSFPVQVMYENTIYRLIRTYDISTPGQMNSFNDFAETQQCVRDVDID